MRNVNSTAIKAIGYNPINHNMRVEFTSGHRYIYKEVEYGTYKALITADSVGKTYHALIRGQYESVKIS